MTRTAVAAVLACLALAAPAAADAPTTEARVTDLEWRMAQCEDTAQEALARAVQSGFLARAALESMAVRRRHEAAHDARKGN